MTVARCRWASPDKPSDLHHRRGKSPGVAWRLPALAPPLAPGLAPVDSFYRKAESHQRSHRGAMGSHSGYITVAQRTVPSGGFHRYPTRSGSGSQRTARASAATIIRGSQAQPASVVRKLKSTLQIVDRQPAPSLLPILRSQQQGEILALLLGDPDLELSLTEIAARTGAPTRRSTARSSAPNRPAWSHHGRSGTPGSSGPTPPAPTTAA